VVGQGRIKIAVSDKQALATATGDKHYLNK
jgi:hypothetical protein